MADWRLDARSTRVLCGVLLALFAVYAGLSAAAYFQHQAKAYPDIFGLWAAGRFATSGPPALVYDPDAVMAFQQAMAPDFHDFYPFSYPPAALLVFAPLGQLGYGAAHLLWVASTLVLFLLAVSEERWRWPVLLAAILAPGTVVALAYGQTGFLIAALLIGGLQLMPGRPVLAGLLLGLLSIKPQLALLAPLPVLLGGHWRCLMSAAATVLVLVGLSSLAFGADIWPEWIASMSAHAPLFADTREKYKALMPTVTANLDMLGLGADMVRWGQIAAAALVVAVVGWALRRGGGRLATALVPVGTFLVTPYAFVYDMPMLTGAVLALLLDAARRSRGFAVTEVLVLFLAMLLPIQMFTPIVPSFPVSTPVLAALLAVSVRRAVN